MVRAMQVSSLPQELVILLVVVLHDGQKDEAYHDYDK